MSKVQVDKVVNLSDDGAPQLTYGAELPVGYGLTGAGGLNITGVVTAASAVFSGNVTIGGTLTYEDVTNIDSVGIVTAQSGIVVSGGEVKVGAAFSVSQAGVVTATSYYGDGSNLSNITSTTINNNANNRLITGSGTANTLEGEATLTYNGTDTFELQPASATPAIFVGDSNRTGAGQGLVHYKGNWNGTTVARITMDAGDDTTNKDDGIIRFDTAPAGSLSEAMRITSAGRLGVGDDSPDTALHVKSADNVLATFESTDADSLIEFKDNGTSDSILLGALGGDDLMLRCDAGAIRFYVANNTEKARITGVGSFAIGNTSPTEKFEVQSGNIAIVGMPGGGGYKIDTHPLLSYASFSLNTGTYACRVGSTGSSTVRHTQIYGGGSHIATFDGVYNRLGVGVTNPAQKLTLKDATSPTIRTILNDTTVGAGNSFGAWEFESLDSSTGCSGVIGKIDCVANANLDGTAANGSQLRFYTSGTNSISLTEKLRITPTGGGVFNGTKGATGSNSMPFSDGYSALEARAPEGTTQFTVTNTTYEDTTFNNEAGIWFKGNYSGNNERAKSAIIHQNSADYGVGHLVFCVDGAADNGNATIANDEVMRLLQNGDVLIQATSADMNDADNLGFTYNHHATGPYIRVKHAGNGGSYSNYTLIHFVGGTSVIGEIKQDGDGTITYATSSDYRLKENIVDLTGAITRVKNLKPKRFNFKLNSGLTKDGFLAHELKEVVPESVNGTKDEVVTADGKANNPTLKNLNVGDPIYQTADASRVVPLLTAALQEAIAKIETLETKVAALESN